MNKTVADLFILQTLELALPKKGKAKILALREHIPTAALDYFDRFLSRGKTGVALVKNGICAGCHIQVPIGVVSSLILGVVPLTCGNCGRYLCLLEEDARCFRDRNSPEMRVAKPSVPTLRQKTIRSGKKLRSILIVK